MNEATEERRRALHDLSTDLDAAREQFHSHRPEMICAQALFLIARQLEVLLSRTPREGL